MARNRRRRELSPGFVERMSAPMDYIPLSSLTEDEARALGLPTDSTMRRTPAQDLGRQLAREYGSMDTVGDWTGLLPQSDDAATRRHRRAQGEWRTDVLAWPAGAPRGSATRTRYPTLPNLLSERHGDLEAESAGVNLMSPAARSYTRDRLPVIEALDGTALRDRLYRNTLSSQPLAFSIAGELRTHRSAAASLLGELAGSPAEDLADLSGEDATVPAEIRNAPRYQSLSQYTLTGIEAEWYPPRWAHTNDRSGFDIAACLLGQDGRRTLLSIEVKYVDKFAAKKVIWDRYSTHLEALELSREAAEHLVDQGCSQVLRQVMITDSVRRLGLSPGVGPEGRVDEAMAVVLARSDDQRARHVVEVLDAALPSMRVLFWSHQELFDAAIRTTELSQWGQQMKQRYVIERTCG